MFTGPVGPVEVISYWPEAVLGNFYWPGAIGLLLASSPDASERALGINVPTMPNLNQCNVLHITIIVCNGRFSKFTNKRDINGVKYTFKCLVAWPWIFFNFMFFSYLVSSYIFLYIFFIL